jgi:hypothetical protein
MNRFALEFPSLDSSEWRFEFYEVQFPSCSEENSDIPSTHNLEQIQEHSLQIT